MNAKLRPSFSQIVAELEKKQAERKQKVEPAVKGEPFCRCLTEENSVSLL